jgi:mannose/fructose/N-acetylgalactosamine-specific phosphotransferase system component IIB
MLKIARLDDRLIHGQIINNWCTSEDITEIIVINKDVANNDMRKTMIEMSVPEEINILFCDVSDALEIYEEECKYENLMMVFGNPFEILEFIENGGKIESINIGGMSFKKGRKRLSTAVYMNDEEIEVLKKIAEKNIKLEIRILPTDRSIDFLKSI